MTTSLEDVLWDFSKQFEGTTDPKINNTLSLIKNEAQKLHDTYNKGKIETGELNTYNIKEIIKKLKEMMEKANPIGHYSFLLLSKNNSDDENKRFRSEIQEKQEVHLFQNLKIYWLLVVQKI